MRVYPVRRKLTSKQKRPKPLWDLAKFLMDVRKMVVLSDDEAALIKAILIALRGIKMQEIDKALVMLSKAERRQRDRSSGEMQS